MKPNYSYKFTHGNRLSR
uniref:Hypothetical 2.1K protein n=1 Tax=Solanum lycopersicum TaxID=4081 RepID=Q7M2E9_SOLLC